ncbi:MAG: hypothetical protein HY892_18290 [Deltaproteobacteria bacterium]|nr:hypothetical protein [Deltaproteobacteria bacterium]
MDEKSRKRENAQGPEGEFPFLDSGNFPTKREVQEVLSVSGKEQLNRILGSPDPAELVAQMPATDVFITIKELGLPDAVDLINLATPEQIIHFLDLDLWQKDRLRREGISEWLETLEACGAGKLQQVLGKADPEFLIALLQQCLQVSKEEDREEDKGKEEELGGFTLDRVFYVEFREAREAPLLIRILKSINSFDPVYYQDLLDQVYSTLPAEEEEAALRWRKGRLAERGFPDFFDSLEIYRYLPVESRGARGPSPEPVAEPSWVSPGYLEVAGRGSFLYLAAGRRLTEEQIGRLQGEMVHLANQILVAGGADPGEPEAIKESTRRAFQTLDLGLRHLSGEDPDEAARILARLPVSRIFQTGFSLGLDLKFRAEALFRQGDGFAALEGRAEFLDSPYQEMIYGLFLKQPLYFDPAAEGNYRPFLAPADLEETAKRLAELEVLGRVLSRLPGYSAAEIKALRRRPLYQPGPTLAAVLLTGLARWTLTGEWAPQPLSVPELEKIDRRLLDPAVPAAWFEAVQAQVGLESREEETLLRNWLTLALDRLAEEISRVPPDRKLDPRYVSLLLVEK